MSDSFRFEPPEPRAGVVLRPRLLRTLVGRWEHRVTVLTGGAGLGKTTLLTQMVAENRMAPRGDDIWVSLRRFDADAERLAPVVAAAVVGGDGRGGDKGHVLWSDEVVAPGAVAEVVWQRSPTETCIVVDDVHLLPADSTGAAWLAGLVEALPANGHLVLASRCEPPVPLARLSAQNAVLRVAEGDLRFNDAEVAAFAARRGVDVERFGELGGWPAMAELAANVDDHHVAGPAFLWEEVLEPLGPRRRHVLAVLCELGVADERLVSAALGAPVELKRALDGVPLVARDRDGWFASHALWRSAPELALDEGERLVVRRRAAEDLVARGRFDDAVTLLHEVGLWDSLGTVLRRACLATDRLVASQLARWLALGDDVVRRSPAGQLATGIHAAFTRPAAAVGPLTDAAAACRAVDDVDGEVTALAQLARLAWFRQDADAVRDLSDRVGELEATGSPKARGMAALRRALCADLRGDDDEVLADLDTIQPGILDPAWEIIVSYLAGSIYFERGDHARATEIVDRLGPTAHPTLTPFVDYLRGRSWWGRGQFDRVLRQAPLAVEQAERSGVADLSYLAHLLAVQTYAHIGETARARRHIDAALAVAPPPRAGRLSVHSAVMLASVQLAEGDEPAATATLREAVEVHGFDQGAERRAWRQTLSLSYVLLPETRHHWDDLARRGQRSAATTASALVVAARSGSGDAMLRGLGSVEPVRIRAALYFRFATEVAVALAAVGRPEGTALLDLLGPPGRTAARDLARSDRDRPSAGDAPSPGQRRQAAQARALLAAVPAAPDRTTYLAVLGPLALTRDRPDGSDGDDETYPRLIRRRVQEVLAFLVAHRRTTRAAIEGALWPDLDQRSAANNLSVTLNHLRRTLEPARDPREPSYLLRLDGPAVALVAGDGLRIDIDDFNGHLRDAAKAEADGAPSVALDHDLAAIALYRGDLHPELLDVEWLSLDREHYRAGFVATAVRAGELLLGSGEPDHAETVAQRALEIDMWSEGAYAVLVNAALARGDRSTAQRFLDRCAKALATLGLSPSASIEQLQRRVQGA